MIKNFTKDPFFHFLIIGIVLYIFSSLATEKDDIKGKFSLSIQENEAIQIAWEEAWGRPATPEELKSLMIQKKQEEMFFQEAIKMGLHKEDTFIYERLVRKTKYLISSIDLDEKIDDAHLKNYYENHLDNYRKNGLFSFSHLFISIDHDNPIKKAEEMRVLLQDTGVKAKNIDAFGDQFKKNHFKNFSQSEIEKIFGKGFYKQLNNIKKRRWSEPIISSVGIHLVFITHRSGGEVTPYESIKESIKSDFLDNARFQHYHKRLQHMMEK